MLFNHHKLFFNLILVLLFFPSALYPAKTTAKNAGMLPYTEHKNEMYILFGLENRFQDAQKKWVKKAGTMLVWADFGGKCDAADMTDAPKYQTDQPTLCAAREAAEETRYVFGNNLPLKSGLNETSPEFDKSVRYFISHTTKHFKINGFYDQFFAKVGHINAKDITNSHKVPHYEKSDYVWVKVKDLVAALKLTDANGYSHIAGHLIFPTLARSLRRADIFNFLETLTLPVPKKPSIEGLGKLLAQLNTQLIDLRKKLSVLK